MTGRSPHKAPRGISIPLGAFDVVEDYDPDFLPNEKLHAAFYAWIEDGWITKIT